MHRILIALAIWALLPATQAMAQTQSPPAAAAPAETANEYAKRLQATLEEFRAEMREALRETRRNVSELVRARGTGDVTQEQVIAISVGAVAGALVVDVLGGGGIATLTGAALGGFVGHWLTSASGS